ncbi:MAG: hypothetical protein WA936_10985 [Erythrobacter sp.]
MVANADRMIANTRAAGSGRAGGFVVGFNNSVSAGNLRATLVAAQRENPDLKINGVPRFRAQSLRTVVRDRSDHRKDIVSKRTAMTQSKAGIIMLVVLEIGFRAGFVLTSDHRSSRRPVGSVASFRVRVK